MHPTSRLAVPVVAALLLSCAAKYSLSTRPEDLRYFRELSVRNESALESFGALYRVKMWRYGKLDDFRMEIFSEDTTRVSLFIRGFLGRSVFKAVTGNDSLRLHFVGAGKHFEGKVADLDTASLRDSKHIADYLLPLLCGRVRQPDTTLWRVGVGRKGKRLSLFADDKIHNFRIAARTKIDEQKFPYLTLERVELSTNDREHRLVLEVYESRYNREIGAAKFALEIPQGSVLLTPEEVAELLTGLEP